MHTYLQGRKISIDENCQRPPGELLHPIRKLRWLGMEEEAEDLHAKLQETAPTGGVFPIERETD
jgi:hypothetical protein